MGRNKEKSKKHKKEKRNKKEKKKSKKHYSSSEESSSSQDEWVEKREHHSSPDQSNSPTPSSKRDDWMNISTSFASTSNTEKRRERKEEKQLEKEREKYNPKRNVRELNPYWKNGGDGLPSFKKPNLDAPEESFSHYQGSSRPKPTSNWRKTAITPEKAPQSPKTAVISSEEDDELALSDKELNLLASKLIKAEIMGNTALTTELKAKLDRARKYKQSGPRKPQTEDVLLTQTNPQGQARPLRTRSGEPEPSRHPRKKQKLETHQDGERVRYFADDDDTQSLKQMFENEKYSTIEDQNNEYIKMAGKVRKNDDLDDIFTDNIRLKESDARVGSKNRDKAIEEHRRMARSVDNCRSCIQSAGMPKHLMVSLGGTVFLSLPAHEPLTEGHCLITPVRHAPAATLLDENEWSDVMDVRKALARMFLAGNEDVIFFETAKKIDRHPHMTLECVPIGREEGEMAPIYFKKAIDECETEWVQNKKLVSLKGRDVRRAVPKGLSYFFVSFGMDEGYAHVIEDEDSFPDNFAQEIIGGMLDLHHGKWKRPKQQSFDQQSKRVADFAKKWAEFDVLKDV